MKRAALNLQLIAILILLLIMASVKGRAQDIEISTGVQQTVMGLQKGLGLDYRWSNGLGVGAFFQSTRTLSMEKSSSNYPFMGADLSIPIKRCQGLELLGHLKGGVVNRQFLIITPEVETRINLAKFIKLGFGIGIRSRQAAVSGKIIFVTS